MKSLAVLTAAAAVAMLAGCGTTTTTPAISATGGAAATHTSAPLSCKQQYKTWKYGPARAIVKQQLGPALKAVTAAGSVQDLLKMQAALKRTGRVAAELAAYPIPRCADPKGYWPRMLALLQAGGDNASTSGGLAGLLAAMGPLQSVKGIEAKLGAELKKNAGVP